MCAVAAGDGALYMIGVLLTHTLVVSVDDAAACVLGMCPSI